MRPFRSAALLFAALLFVAGFFANATHASASPSNDLGSVLSTIRGFLSIDFDNLVSWAKNGNPAPENPVFTLEKTELAIDNLDDADRDAVLSWLRGNGRSKLHDRGASDSDIGPARSSIESSTAASTPNPWRAIPLASNSIDSTPQMAIQLLGGFAAVKKDGTGAIVCLSFKNVDPRVANHVVIEFPFLDGGGATTGTLVLDRTGEFSPNIDIRSFESLAAWQGGIGPHSQNDGCIGKSLPTAAIPFLQARAVGYRVTHVDYVGAPAAPAAAH
jgi:hypothetical protein